MGNNYFKFKQFTVYQDKTAMKVGTDGVLLGAYADAGNFNKILDVGTGTGLISLMMAQQNPKAEIIALEIDKDAYSQAFENVAKSKFNNIKVLNTSFQDFARNSNTKFDLIISNPPFFKHNSFLPAEKNRTIARHTNTLSPEELISFSSLLLNKKNDSLIKIIYPFDLQADIENISLKNNLYVNHKIYIKTTPEKQAKRIVFFISHNKKQLQETELIIEQNGRHNYSEDYIELTKEYYL